MSGEFKRRQGRAQDFTLCGKTLGFPLNSESWIPSPVNLYQDTPS